MLTQRTRNKTSLLLFLIGLSAAPMTAAKDDRPYLRSAQDTARWILASAARTEQGIAWPAVPPDMRTLNNSLYSGTPGVMLFLVEMYYSTGEKSYLHEARKGGDYLLATLSKEKLTGFYTGISGVGFALHELFKATQDDKYLSGVRACLDLVKTSAVEKGGGIAWSDTTDIISGSAGTGLFLLHAARELDDPPLRELAVGAGRRLLELGQPAAGGLKWAMDPNFKRLMPNFSHGTAGIAYFLASLHMETGRKEFLDAALAGARYLTAVAETQGDVCLIFHNEPEGTDLYYLGWCHGPVGTARLFYRLFQITGDRSWMAWVEKCAKGVLVSGIPEKQTPGFWNNVGVCCGSAGVAEFFLSLYKVTDKQEYLEFARHLTGHLLEKASRDEKGLRWVQAEHRSRPELLQAQTGLMQGASGIGLWLLGLDAFDRKDSLRIVFPDNPFRGKGPGAIGQRE